MGVRLRTGAPHLQMPPSHLVPDAKHSFPAQQGSIVRPQHCRPAPDVSAMQPPSWHVPVRLASVMLSLKPCRLQLLILLPGRHSELPASQTKHLLFPISQPNRPHFDFVCAHRNVPSVLHSLLPVKQTGSGGLLQGSPVLQSGTHTSFRHVSIGLHRDLHVPPAHSSHGLLHALLQQTASLH
jgi:hypothetical protein